MEPVLNFVASALEDRQYSALGDELDRMELNEPDLFETPEWPHSVQILAHLYNFRLEDARFAYKRIPEVIRSSDEVIQAAFRLLQRLWVKDYVGIWPALDYAWPPRLQGLAASLQARMQDHLLQLVEHAYVDVSISTITALLALRGDNEAQELAHARRWDINSTSGLLIPKRGPVVAPISPSEADLQRLAQYAVYLQSGEPPLQGL